MTSLFSNTMSPIKDGTSSLPRRQSSFAKPPLRALYDLLIAPMEGVSASRGMRLPVSRHIVYWSVHPCIPPRYKNRLSRQPDIPQDVCLLSHT